MNARGNLPHIVHVSGDFPDPFNPTKTPVIRSLIELTDDRFAHQVVSINRVSPSLSGLPASVFGLQRLRVEQANFPRGTALRYHAPPRGILHRTALEQLGTYIAEMLADAARLPDLLVGHKLTIEGIVVSEAARRLQVPYALSIQGNTDIKILTHRPDLRRLLARIYHEAEVVFPFTPWALKAIEQRLGKRAGPTHLLPCPSDLDQPLEPVAHGDGLISVFHLRNYRNKNLSGLVEAYKLLAAAGSAPRLEIIGGGDQADIAACQQLAAVAPDISFPGAMERQDLRERMRRATALVMPSLRESFGLVFIEALFAGIPVIYPKGTAIDGYFDGLPFAISVDAHDPGAIAAAMRQVRAEEAELKAALRQWQQSEASQAFTRPRIGRTFAEGLRQALGG